MEYCNKESPLGLDCWGDALTVYLNQLTINLYNVDQFELVLESIYVRACAVSWPVSVSPHASSQTTQRLRANLR